MIFLFSYLADWISKIHLFSRHHNERHTHQWFQNYYYFLHSLHRRKVDTVQVFCQNKILVRFLDKFRHRVFENRYLKKGRKFQIKTFNGLGYFSWNKGVIIDNQFQFWTFSEFSWNDSFTKKWVIFKILHFEVIFVETMAIHLTKSL